VDGVSISAASAEVTAAIPSPLVLLIGRKGCEMVYNDGKAHFEPPRHKDTKKIAFLGKTKKLMVFAFNP
jgi:hypothetical protein